MKIYKEIGMEEFEPWSGAMDTYQIIEDAGKMGELTAYFEELFPDGASATDINDALWFDGEQVLQDLQIGKACENCGDYEEVEERDNGKYLCYWCTDNAEDEEENEDAFRENEENTFFAEPWTETDKRRELLPPQ